MTKVSVRLAHADELEIVQDLNHELFLSDQRHFNDLNIEWPYEEVGENYFRGIISGEIGVCYVAETDGMIVGYLAGRMQKQHAAYTGRRSELENMFVKDDYRSSGVGAKLVDAFFEWSRKQGTRYAMVNAFSPNTRAIAFYEKQSFEPYSTTLWKDLNNVEDESL